MHCPYCKKPIPPALVKSAAALMSQKKRAYRTVDRPCPRCGLVLGARELRLHHARCPQKPRRQP
jgi:hypothetical protein